MWKNTKVWRRKCSRRTRERKNSCDRKFSMNLRKNRCRAGATISIFFLTMVDLNRKKSYTSSGTAALAITSNLLTCPSIHLSQTAITIPHPLVLQPTQQLSWESDYNLLPLSIIKRKPLKARYAFSLKYTVYNLIHCNSNDNMWIEGSQCPAIY